MLMLSLVNVVRRLPSCARLSLVRQLLDRQILGNICREQLWVCTYRMVPLALSGVGLVGVTMLTRFLDGSVGIGVRGNSARAG